MTDVLARSREPHPPPPRPSRNRSSGWFRAVWRWHFFASFLVAPVLLLLASTGLIYLFRFQLEPLLHPSLYDVDTTEGRLPIEELLSGRTMRSSPGLAWKYLAQIERACRGARFNSAHEVIAACRRV